MRLKCTVVVLLLSLVFTLLPLKYAEAATTAPSVFTFIHFTDPHFGSGVGNKNAVPVLSDIKEEFADAAFLVNTGDMTEFGLPPEYEAYLDYLKPLSLAVHNTPGNHESRWADAGKSYFRQYLGQPYSSWDYGGLHFVTLDTSLAKGQNGHLEAYMLSWLKQDLAKINKNTPVIIFTHHPLFFDEGVTESNFTDNDWDLWPVIKDYNVRAIFTGHGHINKVWQVNGLTIVMTKAAMESGYASVTVDLSKQEMTVVDHFTGEQEAGIPAEQVLTTISLAKPATQRGIKIRTLPSAPVTSDTYLLQADLQNWPDAPTQVEYKLEDNGWKAMDLVNGHYEENLDLTNVDDGYRTLWVRAVSSDGSKVVDKGRLKYNRNGQLQVAWEYTAAGGIQGAPAVGGKYIYVGDNSGKITALEQASGRKIWEFKTGGAILSSLTLANANIYAGSADGKVYALKASSGAKLWEYKTGGAVIAQPLVANGLVLVGSSDYHFYALNEKNGQKVWDFAAGSTIMMKAAADNNTVFFGSWDNNFYALDMGTGKEKWRQPLGTQAYYAPAAASPLFYQGMVYISTPGSRIVAYNGATGKLEWESEASAGLSTPLIYNDALLYTTLGGIVFALDPLTGANVWQAETRLSNFGASPALFGGSILLHSLQGKLISVNPITATSNNEADNTASFSLPLSIKLDDAFIIADGSAGSAMIYQTTMAGKVYAVKSTSGAKPAFFPLLTAFADTGNHWARLDLNKLAKLGLIKGFADETYKPDLPVTRAQLAGILSRYLKYEVPSSTFKNPFTDTVKHWAETAISAMSEKNIAGGYQDSKGHPIFKPDANVKRAEAVVMLARALGLNKPSAGFKTGFADIDNHWAKDAIMALEEKGFLGGYQENGQLLFKPENTMNRGEIGALIVRVAGVKS